MSWNSGSYIGPCVDSITRGGESPTPDIWVVDNNSHDRTAEYVQERFPFVHVVRNLKNIGYAAANNQAIRHSTGKYILLLNPDTLVGMGAIETLADFLDENTSAGAVGPMLVSRDDSLQLSVSPRPSLRSELTRLLHLSPPLPRVSYPMERWALHVPREVQIAQGAALLVRRKAFGEIGLLDEQFFMYTEEVDLCHRLRKVGWTIHWVPTAKVIHYGGQSTKLVPTESFLNLYRSKILYFRKHHGVAAAMAYKLILIAAGLARLIAGPLVMFEREEQRKRRLALVARYSRLLIEIPSL